MITSRQHRPSDVLVNEVRDRSNLALHAYTRCIRTLSGENVHNLRLAARHLLAALDVWRNWAKKDKCARKAERCTRSLFRSMGPLRDAQVRVGILRDGARKDDGLAPALRLAVKEERALRNRMRERLSKMGTMPLVEFREHVENGRPLGRASAALQHTLAHRRERLAERWVAIDPAQPRTLHRARIALKKYRYLIDVFAPLLPPALIDQRGHLKRLQHRLGSLHDDQLLLIKLRNWLPELGIEDRNGLNPTVLRLAQRMDRRNQGFMRQKGVSFLWDGRLGRSRRRANSRSQ